jgi:hypothetical protein
MKVNPKDFNVIMVLNLWERSKSFAEEGVFSFFMVDRTILRLKVVWRESIRLSKQS